MPKTSKSVALDAVALLKADHRAVDGLFAAYDAAKGRASKAKLAQQICLELIVHAAIEEEIFYPAMRDKIEGGMLDEAYVEHDGAKILIADLLAGAPGEDFYDAKIKVLSENIKHHVKEEEQRGGLFAQAKDTDVDLKELGQRLAARKSALKRQFKINGIPTPETRSMRGVKVRTGRPVR